MFTVLEITNRGGSQRDAICSSASARSSKSTHPGETPGGNHQFGPGLDPVALHKEYVRAPQVAAHHPVLGQAPFVKPEIQNPRPFPSAAPTGWRKALPARVS